ncbi:MAG TPA: CBS domain-containing protein [Kribbella sp.]|nr:CBS domain-containing protein [Kribbella sp.]
MLIRELMTSPAVTVMAKTPISEALRLLDDHKITAMPVIDGRGDLIGVVSEADLVPDALQLEDRVQRAVHVSNSRARQVFEVMTHLVVSVHGDDELDAAIDLLRSTMVKSLPVVEHGQVVGMISRSDVIHLLAGRDKRIRDDVAELFVNVRPDWQVEVQDGVVKIITGLSDDDERRRAEALAGTVRGVVAVQVC